LTDAFFAEVVAVLAVVTGYKGGGVFLLTEFPTEVVE
jgi:hypothetical protein